MDLLGGFIRDAALAGQNQLSLNVKGAYVSYLAHSSVGPETALHLDHPGKGHGKFWNLCGDHREGYAAAYEKAGLRGLKAYYREHQDVASEWTEYGRLRLMPKPHSYDSPQKVRR